MRRQAPIPYPSWLLVLCVCLAAGGTAVARGDVRLEPVSLEKRQLQTRRFEGISEADLLAASAGVLQDLGFNLDESESALGLIVGSKERRASEPGKATALTLLRILGVDIDLALDERQRIRVSIVTRPIGPPPTDEHQVRVTFQRVVWNTANEVSKSEAIEEAELYQGFFDRLSKSVFLEAHKL